MNKEQLQRGKEIQAEITLLNLFINGHDKLWFKGEKGKFPIKDSSRNTEEKLPATYWSKWEIELEYAHDRIINEMKKDVEKLTKEFEEL